MSIGSRLKEARLRCGMKQEELARAVGVTKGAVGNYETGVSSPKESVLIKLMEVLGVDANYLYQDYVDFPEGVANRLDLSTEEQHLVAMYRGADEQARSFALEMLENHQIEEKANRA